MQNRTYWRNLLLFGIGASVAGLIVGTVYGAHKLTRAYMHPPRAARTPGDTPDRLGAPYQDLLLTTVDGLQLSAWYTPPENSVVILVAHGYGDQRIAALHALFARHQFGVLSWDFRAHGQSKGEQSTLGYDEALDVEAALDFALSQPGVEYVGAWGGSMGGVATIVAAARRSEIKAVVVDSVFATLEDELELAIRYPILRSLIRFFAERETGIPFQALQPAQEILKIEPRPIMIIQGLADRVTPSDSGRLLCIAAGASCTLWSEPGVGHLDMIRAYPETYERTVVSFFQNALVTHD